MEIIKTAIKAGQSALSEYESKQVLAAYNISITKETVVHDILELQKAIQETGYPVVLKGSSPDITHKTELGLIKIDLRNEVEVREAFVEIMQKVDGPNKGILVQEMIRGQRELVVGMVRDPQFGPCIMFGLGGIFTEVLKDVAFRAAPLEKRDALELMDSIRATKILQAIRGMKAVDREVLADILIAVGQIGLDNEDIKEIDINPLKIRDGKPIAVDALIILNQNT